MTPERVREAFGFQSKACADLGSPFMRRLMALFATRNWPDGPITDRIFDWDGDLGPRAQSVPLRLAGALHALHLQGHTRLGQVYPPQEVSDDRLWAAVCASLTEDHVAIDRWLDSPPQTNEVRRAATLIALGHWLADRFKLPMRTSELGASGGLNLHWDSYGLEASDSLLGPEKPALTLCPDWRGAPPPETPPQVVDRAGVDLNPLDPGHPADALRLQAYLWPDQPERLSLTRAAIGAATTKVVKADAIDWLVTRMDHVPGQLHLIYSTIAWQYFPEDKQAAGVAMITAAGAQATEETPLAWFGMEQDGGNPGAALTLRLWPGDVQIPMGRADFHGRWVDWRAP